MPESMQPLESPIAAAIKNLHLFRDYEFQAFDIWIDFRGGSGTIDQFVANSAYDGLPDEKLISGFNDFYYDHYTQLPNVSAVTGFAHGMGLMDAGRVIVLDCKVPQNNNFFATAEINYDGSTAGFNGCEVYLREDDINGVTMPRIVIGLQRPITDLLVTEGIGIKFFGFIKVR